MYTIKVIRFLNAESPERGILFLGRISAPSAVEQVFCSSPAANLVGVEEYAAGVKPVVKPPPAVQPGLQKFDRLHLGAMPGNRIEIDLLFCF